VVSVDAIAGLLRPVDCAKVRSDRSPRNGPGRENFLPFAGISFPFGKGANTIDERIVTPAKVTESLPEDPPELTRREHDVLVALCRPALDGELFTEPASVREIAAALVVTEAAVKQHLGNLWQPLLQVQDRRDGRAASRRARQGGLSPRRDDG
jgi:hypothetical protein